MSENVHVYPVASEHTTEGLDCWCAPRYLLPCDDCDDGCWKCEGGSIALTREQAEASWDAIVIVHNRSVP